MPLYVSEVLRIRASFTDDFGSAVDPTTPVTVSVWENDGTLAINEATATAVATGVYEYLFTPATDGPHSYRFTSADNAVETGDFVVRANP